MRAVTSGNVAHLIVVVVAIAAFVVLGATRAITGDACVSGILGVVAGAAPAGVGVASRERNGSSSSPTAPTPPAS